MWQSRRQTTGAPTIFTSPKRARRWLAWFAFLLVAAGLGTFGWLSYQATAALSQISDAPTDRQQGGLLGLPFLTNRPEVQTLRGEDEGRVNIVLLGMGGTGHQGGMLTDTIMLLSIKPKEDRAALLSIPRDLYVPIPDAGSAKINSAHAVGEQRKSGEGPALAKTVVGNVLDLPIHYYVRIDFAGFTKLVDAVSGLDITVEKAIADPFYPDERLVGYAPFYLKAGPTHMDGKLALKYARSRETTSDFDRARRQQHIVSALKDKVLSVETLSNPQRVTELLDIAGSHVRTDLAVWEMQRLASWLPAISRENIASKVLDTSAGSPLTSRSDPGAGYIIIPRRGMSNFSDVHKVARDLFGASAESTSRPTIAILNASGDAAAGGEVALRLRNAGYEVKEQNSVTKSRARSMVYTNTATDFSDLMNLLTSDLRIKAAAAEASQTTDFLIIIGQDYRK